jgi:hypothetical protein
MSFIHNSITLGLQITPLIEDPNTANNRIFLSGIGHDQTYITPIFNSVYQYQTGTNINLLQATGYGNMNTPTVWGGNLLLNRASIWTGRSTDGTTNADKDAWSAYHRSLDPVNYPAKRSWYTVNNRSIITLPYQDLNNASGHYNTYIVHSSDITTSTGAIYSTSTQGTTTSTVVPNNLFFEDATNNRMWGVATSNVGVTEYFGFVSSYDTAAPVAWMNNSPTAGPNFFIGVDTANNVYWVRNQDTTVGDPYTIFQVKPTSVITTISNIVTSAGSGVAYTHSRPSNLRYDAANLRVFYSSHFDGGNNLVPVRYQWDPTNTAGFFTSTTCTMTYGTVTAAGSYTFYASKFPTTGGTTVGDSFHIKPQQFRPATSTGTYYLTFWLTDKATTSTNAPLRWGTPATRTMMTYAVSSATDTNLVYHSSYTFTTATSIPRDFLPVSADGSQVVVTSLGVTQFFTFSTSTGWAITNTYPYEFVSMGLDQQNRLFGVGKETAGYYSVHMITPTLPVNVTVNLSSATYVYNGTPISTSASITAFNSAGTAIVSTLTLSISGSSMVFAANGLTSYTTTTSATNPGTTVNLTINGSGINNIIVGASI